MPRTLTVGLDGSPESLAAADWAGREAALRDLTLRLIHASQWQSPLYAPRSALGIPVPPPGLQHDCAQRLLDEARSRVARRHPDLTIESDDVPGLPAQALIEAARDTDLLVLGSRGLGKVAGFLLGSVSLTVLAGSERPVVLVRSPHPDPPAGPDGTTDSAPGGDPERGDVVLGLDLRQPGTAVIDFAFEEASRRAARLRVVHGWTLPPYFYGGDLLPEARDDLGTRVERRLADVLEPWRRRFPAVEVAPRTAVGDAGELLVDASHDAALAVVGRRIRRAAVGRHIGPVVQALAHHGTAPVAVVPHD
ncbi:universal stress protein [Streptomyces sp. NPDC048566]|uniref:universal stress protein n=1 Tax=Streptomyces sp. NPDC048566 TaxID=3365569 RepID=UPI003724320B